LIDIDGLKNKITQLNSQIKHLFDTNMKSENEISILTQKNKSLADEISVLKAKLVILDEIINRNRDLKDEIKSLKILKDELNEK
jgi:chromosome segregation ATPase